MQFKRIHIELTSRCNFNCKFCAYQAMTRKPGAMDFGLLTSLLDQIAAAKLTDLIYFHIMGEALLYPKFNAAIDYAKSKGLKVCLTTNGWVNSENVIALAKVDTVMFSVQTPDEKSFALRRAPVNFAAYKSKVTQAVAKLLKLEKRPKIIISFLTTLHGNLFSANNIRVVNSQKELIKMFWFWFNDILVELKGHSLGMKIEAVRSKIERKLKAFNLFGWNSLQISPDLFFDTHTVGDWLHPALTADKFTPAKIGACEGLIEQLGVLWNGDVVFCCLDFDGKTKFGNIGQKTLSELLAQGQTQKFAAEFKRLRIKHPYCQRCLGDVSFGRALAKQFGAIIYFKFLRIRWEKKRLLQKALIKV